MGFKFIFYDSWEVAIEYMREIITLECTDCKNRNYTTKKNPQNDRDRVELKKYCKFCNEHTVHKETG